MAVMNGKGIFLNINEAIHCFLITSPHERTKILYYTDTKILYYTDNRFLCMKLCSDGSKFLSVI